jgi:orotidine-5'-phosphate decarboxylase
MIIVALDVETAAEARSIIDSLGSAASFYKIGLELYASAGPDFVRELKSRGHRVFLDLKLYDIGETVRRAVVQVAKLGADFLTIHSTRQVVRAAVEGRAGSNLKLLAVTVLTSVDDADLLEDGFSKTTRDLVALRAAHAIDDGADGLICSALDLRAVRAIAPRAILVTPGVRSAGANANDQKRVATPKEAISNGADYLVIGRQITRAKDPRAELIRVCNEIKP